ncbi:unnamed protein product [Cuscuta campestris]|uniref:HTH myb-type domain-containing protein n=1 Tax=Cuscuta campestris TaxID=132261 RepID=A0A484KPA5_9ASTE|nr:unnamed protein product [Cuscuta campestris]
MDSNSPELRLDSNHPLVLRTVTEFLGEISMIGDVSERLARIEHRLRMLEDEMRKIDGFKRELPLCMFLLADAITVLKEESKRCRKSLGEPVLEEFLPVKKTPVDDDGDDINKVENVKEKDCKEKVKWTSSFKLWDGGDKGCSISDSGIAKHGLTTDLRTMGNYRFPMEESPSLSLSTPGIKNEEEDAAVMDRFSSKIKKLVPYSGGASSGSTQLLLQSSSRKQRRCWSPELHRTFVDALQQLGGPQVATPKQIRDLMQVEGLTNDEVKSHLQKYRLHVQRLPAGHSSSPGNKSIVILGHTTTTTNPTSTDNNDNNNNNTCMAIDQKCESSKQSSSQSGSPQGILQLAASSQRTFTSGSESIEDDNKSE